MNELRDITNKATQDIISNLFREMQKDLRSNAVPPIKGELTKGKIRWRGIVMCHSNTLNRIERWLEQRGKKISRVFTIDLTVKLP